MPAMVKADAVSVKFEEHKRPADIFEGDSRLDGRGYEMFRSVCESKCPIMLST